jgi:hypothetical protein
MRVVHSFGREDQLDRAAVERLAGSVASTKWCMGYLIPVWREMIRAFAQKMMDAEVETACGAGYGEVSPARVNSRNGYRPREWDTRQVLVFTNAAPRLRRDCAALGRGTLRWLSPAA